jgi:hypothetical protein
MKWLILLSLFLPAAHAFDYPYTIRSPRALLMGDAFTAVNDDEFTLFYNPASLARHKRDFTLHPFNPQLHGTNLLNDLDRFQNFPEDPAEVSEVLMDYPAHASVGISPGFKFFNVGVTFLAQESYDVLLRDPSHPMLDLDLRSDKGIVIGVGIPLGPSRLSKKSQMGSQTSIGFTGKYLERTGIRDTLAISGPVVLESFGQDELKKLLESLGQVKGIGYGFDAGFEHIVKNGNSQFVIGLAALDITGTNFTEESTVDNLQVADIRNQINLGIAGGQNFGLFHYILSADVRGLNDEIEMGRRLRLGAEFGIPGLRAMAGLNSGYYSYGASLDLGFMNLTAGLYDMEIGPKYKQIKSSRFLIYLSLFDFSFDS